jgi:hypothetical protein
MLGAMLITDAEQFFGGRKGIAQALSDRRSLSAVYQWEHAVPLAMARRLAEISQGKLSIDESVYDEMGRVNHKKFPQTA